MYQKLKQKLSEIADIHYTMALMSWDQEIYMPENGAARRGQQIATLAGIAHEKSTSTEMGEILEALSKDSQLSHAEKRNVELTLKNYTKAKKFTTAFVENKSRTISEAFNNWQKAKEAKDFNLFQPYLEKIVAITREECELLGYEGHPYNALIDQYEPDMTVAELDALFEDVKAKLKPLLASLKDRAKADDSFLLQQFPKQEQLNFGEALLAKLGYDFKSGRQDLSSHPFCTSFNALDVRVTTRVDEKDLANSVWSTIHECGHALYEQGLPDADYGLPTSEAISLGIHESQSRFWENCIGRSSEFIDGFGPLFKAHFPNQLGAVSNESFYKGINKVEPSLIRTEADELTYHFHVMIRYEIEKDIVSGKLAVKDVKRVWNEKYKEYLGIDVPHDGVGVLQDVHWSHGGIGYFPTYSLGSFYAAQWWSCIQRDIPNAKELISKGETKEILQWLRTHVHQYGKLYSAEDLCKRISGEKLNFNYFMEYAQNKYSQI